MYYRREWWQKPKLHTEEELRIHRPVTWLELFFDLIFVVIISRLAHNFLIDITIQGFLIFILMFISVFWAWNAKVYYNERFESSGIENRLFTFLTMIPVAGMALFSHNGLTENYLGFSVSYLLTRAINIFTWVRAGWHVKEFRPISNRFAFGFGIVVTLIIISYFDFVLPELKIVLWAIAAVIDIIVPYFTMNLQAKLPKISSSKFPERFGLFTIIVLGETIVGVINGMSEVHGLTNIMIIDGILAIYISFAIWWLYFDFVARRSPKYNIYIALAWVYLHLLLMLTITISGVGIFKAIESSDHLLNDIYRIILAFSIGFILIFIGLLEFTLLRKEDEPTHPKISPLLKIGSGLVLLLLGYFFTFLNSTLAFLMLIGFLVINQIYGLYVWFTQKLPIKAEQEQVNQTH